MKQLLLILFLASAMIISSGSDVLAQKKAQRTASGRAAYGNAIPFDSHVRKNKKSKKKARKAVVRKKKFKSNNQGYRRIPM